MEGEESVDGRRDSGEALAFEVMGTAEELAGFHVLPRIFSSGSCRLQGVDAYNLSPRTGFDRPAAFCRR